MSDRELNTNTLALMNLTEKLTENNNTVSGTMRLMSDNIEEVSEIALRSEEKVDECKKMIKNHCELWNPNSKVIIDFIKKLNEVGFADFLIRVRKIWKAIVLAIIAAIVIAAAKWIYGGWKLAQKFIEQYGG